ncbi:unnamed protein product [Lota lota]
MIVITEPPALEGISRRDAPRCADSPRTVTAVMLSVWPRVDVQFAHSMRSFKMEEARDTRQIAARTVHTGVLSPGALSPGALSPGVLSPGALNPGALSPGALSSGAQSPGAQSPGAWTHQAQLTHCI